MSVCQSSDTLHLHGVFLIFNQFFFNYCFEFSMVFLNQLALFENLDNFKIESFLLELSSIINYLVVVVPLMRDTLNGWKNRVESFLLPLLQDLDFCILRLLGLTCLCLMHNFIYQSILFVSLIWDLESWDFCIIIRLWFDVILARRVKCTSPETLIG